VTYSFEVSLGTLYLNTKLKKTLNRGKFISAIIDFGSLKWNLGRGKALN